LIGDRCGDGHGATAQELKTIDISGIDAAMRDSRYDKLRIRFSTPDARHRRAEDRRHFTRVGNGTLTWS
jgi:hypothetical protein